MSIVGLETFPEITDFPQTEDEICNVLRDSLIRKIEIFALGPAGTNIEQAAHLWILRMGVSRKTEFKLCDTPESCLMKAREVSREGCLAIFWTCAVYAKENEFFFTNLDTLPFFTQQVMLLDEMQLATRGSLLGELLDKKRIPGSWVVASHPSPAPLVRHLPCKVVLVNSNAEAAKQCVARKVEACITTEKARAIYQLAKLHSFGSPPMVFFGGIAPRGIELVQRVWSQIKHFRSRPSCIVLQLTEV